MSEAPGRSWAPYTNRKNIVMFKEFTGRYHVHESSRSFADVVAALEAAVGSVENETFDHELSEGRDPSDFEERMHRHESTSGFMRFHTIDTARGWRPWEAAARRGCTQSATR